MNFARQKPRGRNDVVSPFVLNDRPVILDAPATGIQSSFEEVLWEPVPEAWLALLRSRDSDSGELH